MTYDILLAALGVCLDLGVAATFRQLGLEALRAGFTSSNLGTDSSVFGFNAISITSEAVLSCLPPVQIIKHIFGIGPCGFHLFILMGYVAATSYRCLFIHFYVSLSLDTCGSQSGHIWATLS